MAEVDNGKRKFDGIPYQHAHKNLSQTFVLKSVIHVHSKPDILCIYTQTIQLNDNNEDFQFYISNILTIITFILNLQFWSIFSLFYTFHCNICKVETERVRLDLSHRHYISPSSLFHLQLIRQKASQYKTNKPIKYTCNLQKLDYYINNRDRESNIL